MKTKFLITILMLSNLFLYAIDYNAKAIITKDSAFIGDVLKLDIVLNSESKPQDINILSDDSFSVKKLKGFSLIEENKNAYIATYQVVPIVAGELKLPSFITKNDEETFISNPLYINVEQPENSTEMILTAEYSPKKVYIGEVVKVHYVWKSLHPLNSIKSVNIDIPYFNDENFKVAINSNYIDSDNKSAIGLPVHNQRLVGKTEILKFDETRRAYCVSFETILIPLNAGIFEIQAPSLVCAVPKDRDVSAGVPQRFIEKRFLYPAYFDNEFFNYQTEVSTLKKQFVKGETLEIEVLPLPLEGMPEDFSYIIGDYSITAKAPDTNVRVGDTIELNVTIEALNGASLETLSLNKDNFSALGFDKFEISDNLLGRIDANKKIFNLKLLVRGIESTKIPAIKFSFFNPDDEKYHTIKTQEISLKVSPSQSARILNEDGTEILVKTKLTKNKAGIYDTEVDENFFKLKKKSFIGNLTLLEFLILTLATPIIFISIFATKTLKNIFANSSALRDKIAFALKINSISFKKKITPAELESIIQELFSLYIDVEKESMSFVEIEKFLNERQCPKELISKLSEIFNKLRGDSYSMNKEMSSNKDLVYDTTKLLKKINRNLK